MSTKIESQVATNFDVAVSLHEELENFYVRCEGSAHGNQRTVKWYRKNLGRFENFLSERGILYLHQLNTAAIYDFFRHLRQAENKVRPGEGLSDSYINGYARNIKTFILYLYKEDVIQKPLFFDMPTISKKKLPVITLQEVLELMSAASCLRDKAIISLAVDSGLRLSEISNLHWGDVNLSTGQLIVEHGKGDKYRVASTGSKTRQLLIQYRRGIQHKSAADYLFQADASGTGITSRGIRSVFMRLRDKTGVKFSAHALRRTFAKYSVQNGMDITVIQQLMGHENLETTRHYVQALDETHIIENHREHSVMDHIR